MDAVLQDLSLTGPGAVELARLTLRLLASLLVGGVIGLQREFVGKSAGLRTHMLVALGATLLVAVTDLGSRSPDALSRVIQGVATGIGFLGAGAILKLTAEREIHGLTTAAGIWMTAAAATAIGAGYIGAALVSVALGWVVLAVLARFEHHPGRDQPHDFDRGTSDDGNLPKGRR
jgi:putative Mg2+ transporter-C (MgtC) family protein